MTEVWKPIDGYEGIYQVSSLGRVRSLDRTVQSTSKNGKCYHVSLKGRILAQSDAGKGYLKVGLRKNGEIEERYVHRLVAFAFVEGYRKGFVINHKDEDKHNNRADNLEWITQKENLNYGTHTLRQRETLRYAMKPVVMKSIDGQVIREFDCLRSAQRETGIRRDHIKACCEHKNLYYTAGGYRWEYSGNKNIPIRDIPSKKRPVIQINLDGEVIAGYDSAIEAQKVTGFCAGNIRQCCRGVIKTSNGYKWKYKE